MKRPCATREKSWRLRRALIESGLKYACASCTMDPTWNGEELRFHVNHKNGNFADCRRSNLEFLCPNCHSQTKHSGGNGLTGVTSTAAVDRRARARRRGEILVDPPD